MTLIKKFKGLSSQARTVALTLTILLVLSSVFFVFAAIATPQIHSVSVNPQKSVLNGTITFTVKTSTDAKKIKIKETDGSTWRIVNVEQGFQNYTDIGNERTWTITKKTQRIGVLTVTVHAGNDIFYSSGISEIFAVYRTAAEIDDTPLEPTTATTGSSTAPTTQPTTQPTTEPTTKLEPPYPFWKESLVYATTTTVYYMGNIYRNSYYSPAGKLPTSGEPWVLVGPAAWTVPEDPDNYKVFYPKAGDTRVLNDSQVNSEWGGLNPAYSPENAVNRVSTVLSQSIYEELFPYRFGSTGWKTLSDGYYQGADRQNKPDYYSYNNLKQAVAEMSNLKLKVEWRADSPYCTKMTRLDKTTKVETIVFVQSDFYAEWNLSKSVNTQVVDYGSFMAVGTQTDALRELAALLANIAHETGGGNVDGRIDQVYTGLYFNEETTYINSQGTVGYVNTMEDHTPGKSYHGRGPIQLSWNYNYSLFSGIIYGDRKILLDNPERLVSDGVLGFKSAIWFWLTPQPPKPGCHEVAVRTWVPTQSAIGKGVNQNCFGTIIMVINGGLEGNLPATDGRIARRILYYQTFTNKFGVNITGEKLDTLGMTGF